MLHRLNINVIPDSITAQWFRCLMAFSLIRNTKDIFNIEPTNKPGQIGPIHFLRFISMVWVIFGHATASYMLFSCKFDSMTYILNILK